MHSKASMNSDRLMPPASMLQRKEHVIELCSTLPNVGLLLSSERDLDGVVPPRPLQVELVIGRNRHHAISGLNQICSTSCLLFVVFISVCSGERTANSRPPGDPETEAGP